MATTTEARELEELLALVKIDDDDGFWAPLTDADARFDENELAIEDRPDSKSDGAKVFARSDER